MPRKVAAAKPDTEEAKPAEATRRSTRIAEKPGPPAQPAPAKKAPKSKGKRTAEKETEPEEGEPAAKKAKPASKADEPAAEAEASSKPEEGKTSKPASKAAAKPASAAATKPASTAKPASSAKKPVSRRSARNAEPDIAEDEEKEVEKAMEVEDKENQKEEVKAAAAEAEAEVGELKEGDTLPGWTFKNEKDEDVEVAKLAGEKGLVLFLVPKADTLGCTTQACGFRDSYEEFEKIGYSIYSLSADSPAALTKWQTKKNLQYSSISDPKRKLIHALGAKSGSSTKRSHFVFEKGTGKLVDKKLGVKPVDSPKQALEFIKKHHPNDV